MNNLKPSQIVLMASGAVTFLFSFFNFLSFSVFGRDDLTLSAWGSEIDGVKIGIAPLSAFPALLGLAVAGVVAAKAFGNVQLPERVVTLTWPQLFFTAGFASFFILFGIFLSLDFEGADGGFSFGFWLMLLGSIGLLAGAVMELQEGASTSNGPTYGGPPQGGQPPAPF